MNSSNIGALLVAARPATVCDLGGGDGERTAMWAALLPGMAWTIVECHPPFIKAARERGFTVVEASLDTTLPLPTGVFDAVVSNQVLEHLVDTDLFISEAFRILRPGGLAVISTENAASWHNIAALLLGWQPFSLTNVSAKALGLGNPLGLHAGETGDEFPVTMQHRRIFAARGLLALLRVHGFRGVRLVGSGYYPLPAAAGRFDAHHAHFISAWGRKPES